MVTQPSSVPVEPQNGGEIDTQPARVVNRRLAMEPPAGPTSWAGVVQSKRYETFFCEST